MLQKLGNIVWGWPMLLLFLAVGLYYTVTLRGIQLRRLPDALRQILRAREGDGLTPYAALCTALAATIGTGNIVGVATALAAGGPGALFWMLVAAFLGMATQYAECFLAAKYRRSDGFGGPFCYMEKCPFGKLLSKIYALLGCVTGILGVGTVTQSNSITSAVDSFFSSSDALCGRSWAVVISGGLVTLFAALVLLGGAKRIGRVCETLVPMMSGLYLLCCLVLLVCCRDRLVPAVSLIVRSAFSPKAAFGAASGISFKYALRMGISRGVFTNEAGLGTSAIAAASADSDDPVCQGLVSMTGTFIDTIVICTLTGLCLVVTDAWRMPLEGIRITDYAWVSGLPWAQRLSSFLLLVCLVFFAFATVIGWNFYAERCLRYLTGSKRVTLYRLTYLLAIAVAPYFSVRAAWESADLLNALLAVPNLLALFLLRREVLSPLRKKCRKFM